MKTALKAILRASPLRIVQLVAFAIFFVTLLSMCRGVFAWLAWSVFNEPREDMAHGWFVPVFSVALLWLKRRELAKSAGEPSIMGLALAVPGFFLFAAGVLGEQLRISHIAAIWLLWAGFYAVWGKRLAHTATFAVAFLVFTAPMGFLDIFTVKLRMLIAATASGLLDGFGIDVVRSGTGIYCTTGEGFNIDIADPCSGMRSIFALAALTAGYAYLTQKTLRGKWLLFLCAAPLATLGNLARVLSIAIVATAFGKKVALGFYHDYSGYVTFLVAVMAMIWIGEAISRLFASKKADEPSGENAADAPSTEPAPRRPSPFIFAIPILLPIFALIASFRIENAPPRVQESDSFVASTLGALPGYTARIPYFCQNEHCLAAEEVDMNAAPPKKCRRCDGEMAPVSLGEKRVLPKDTRILKCNYYDMLGYGWKVSVIVNGRSRQSIHRPEICLPAQGWSIDRGKIEDFELADGSTISMHCLNVRSRASSSALRMGHAYFFVNPRQKAASHFKRILISVRDRVFAGRITRWAMVTISADEPFAANERRREATGAFLSEFLPMAFGGAAGTGDAGKEEQERAVESAMPTADGGTAQ